MTIKKIKNKRNLKLFKNILNDISGQHTAIDKIRYELPPDSAIAFIRNLEAKKTGTIHKFFENPLPQSIAELRKNQPQLLQHDMLKEINWYYVTFSFYTSQLTKFTEFQEEYETNLFLGNYEICGDILKEINETICYSLWSIEQLFILATLDPKVFDANKIMSEILRDENVENYLCYLTNILSLKAESGYSVLSYDKLIDSQLTATDVTDNKHIENYIRFKAKVFDYENLNEFGAILSFERSLSIIDRYVTFKRALSLIQFKKNEEKDVGLRILTVLNKLNALIDDHELEHLMMCYRPDHSIRKDDLTLAFLNASDIYTIGDYSKSFSLSKSNIIKNPNCFEFYTLYVKSALCCGYRKENILSFDSSLIKEIVDGLYDVFTRANNFKISYEHLLRLSYVFSSMNWGYKLYLFLRKESTPFGLGEYEALPSVLSKIVNVKQSVLHRKKRESEKFLRNFERVYGKHITIDLWDSISSQILTKKYIGIDIPVSAARKLRYSAIINKEIGNYDIAIEIFLGIIEQSVENNVPPHIREDAIQSLFCCYLSTSQYIQACKLVLQAFIANPNSILRLNLKYLASKMDVLDSPSKYFEIAVPIVYLLNGSSKNKVYISLDNMMRICGIKRPLDLIKLADNYLVEEIVVLLGRVCSLDVINKMEIFTKGQAREQRIEMLNQLAKMDPTNKMKYDQEVQDLIKENIVDECILHVEESNEYVSHYVMKEYYISEYTEEYERLKQKTNSPAYIEHRADWSPNTIADTFRRGPQYTRFEGMFYKMRDDFIFHPRWGLDTYLSIKLRHEKLVPMIRTVLQIHGVITQKNGYTGKYTKSILWQEMEDNINFTPEESARLENVTEKISARLDAIIENFSITQMRPKTAKRNESGFFDYIFTEADVYKVYREKYLTSISFGEFSDYILEQLFERTDHNLEKIRQYIEDILKQEIFKCLDDLKNEVSSVSSNRYVHRVGLALIKTRSDINRTFEKLSQNFIRSMSRKSLEFDIKLAIDTAIAIINNTYLSDINVEVSCPSSIKLEGKLFNPFVDVFKLLLQNISKHPGAMGDKASFPKLNIESGEGNLSIIYVNTISEDRPIEEIRRSVVAIKNAIEDGTAYEKSNLEGGSGFFKILNILGSFFERDKVHLAVDIFESKIFTAEITIKFN